MVPAIDEDAGDGRQKKSGDLTGEPDQPEQPGGIRGSAQS